MTDFSTLLPLLDRWPDVFGEPLRGVGFELFPDDMPMLQRCLDANSTAELDAHLADLNSDDSLTR